MALSEVIDTLKQDNSQYTSIGSSQVKPLKQNDSVADILAKIYNFMVKEAEDRKQTYELEKNFEQEKIEEESRKHKELIEALREGKSENKEEKKKGGIWEFLKGSFNFIFSGISKFVGLLSNTFSVITSGLGIISKVVGGIVSFVFGGGIITLLKSILIGLGLTGAGVLAGEAYNAFSETDMGRQTNEIINKVLDAVGKSLTEFSGILYQKVSDAVQSGINSIKSWVDENYTSILVAAIKLIPLYSKVPRLAAFVKQFSGAVENVAMKAKEQRLGKDYIESTREIIRNTPEEVKKRVFGTFYDTSDIESMVQDVIDDPTLMEGLYRPIDPSNPQYDVESRWNPQKKYHEEHREPYDVRVSRQKKFRDQRREQIKQYYEDMGLNLKVTEFNQSDIPVVTDLDTGKEYRLFLEGDTEQLTTVVEKKRLMKTVSGTWKDVTGRMDQMVMDLPNQSERMIQNAPENIDNIIRSASETLTTQSQRLQNELRQFNIPNIDDDEDESMTQVNRIDGSRTMSGIEQHEDINSTGCRNDNPTLQLINGQLSCSF